MANNTEWLDNEIEDMLLRHLLWITSKNPEKGDFDILPHKLAITAKISEIEKQAYNKGYIDGGIYGITQLTENLTERG